MRWRSLNGERRTVTNAIRLGDNAIARGQWDLALRHYGRANHHAVRVAQAGEGDQDQAVLGSIFYNLAELHVQTGEASMAWLCALQACQVYGRLDPTNARPTAVRSSLVGPSHFALPTSPPAEERIALNADARSRYVLLSAGMVRTFGSQALRVDVGGGALDGITDAPEVIERIGEPAVHTYQELVRHSTVYTEADVTRTRQRLTKARSIIGA
ncbi:hypothetical protein LO772_14535 [Yinghuangia sp. ASG 101]|uniref:hypothetical protein n=1 Tax=Yinghuangia sp. ASG 101 TaxID=2896848 RepID=UPI001E4958CA|nr:hypothetical protein [Yinghuangia sp. ASG 101]UGQ14686.1 hypothetical protein LO772_14535 [Yinghuangia sp. ASG 101]